MVGEIRVKRYITPIPAALAKTNMACVVDEPLP